MYPFTVIYERAGVTHLDRTRALSGREAGQQYTHDAATGEPLEETTLVAVLPGHHMDASDDDEAPAQAGVAEIARSCLGIGTLETRNSDGADFHDVAVWAVREALERAFEAGRTQATL